MNQAGKLKAGAGAEWLLGGFGLLKKQPLALGTVGLVFAIVSLLPLLFQAAPMLSMLAQLLVVVLTPILARTIAALGLYANLPNYRNNWRRLGFSEEEIESRAPRLLDALVAWGTPERVRERIREHHDAGADHVCIQPLLIGDAFRVDRAALEQLAG